MHQAVKQSGLFIIILVLQSERLMCVPIDPFLISGAPRRCIRRTTGDWGGQSSLWDTDVVGAEISEYLFFFVLVLRKTLARGAAFVGVPLK